MMLPGQYALICDRCRIYKRVWGKDDVRFVVAHADCHPQYGVRAVRASFVPSQYAKAP
jgi:hypothetical protein